MCFLQQFCDKNHPLHLKVRIDSKSYTVNVFSIVTRGRGVYEITVNEIAALVFITEILDENDKLLLTLKALIE